MSMKKFKIVNKYSMTKHNLLYGGYNPDIEKNYLSLLRDFYPTCVHDRIDNTKYTGGENVDKVNPTYGEMTFEGLDTLYSKLGSYNFNSWMDLGSGRGKLLFYMAKFDEIKKVIGVEIVKKRMDFAIISKNKLLVDDSENSTYIKKIILLENSMFNIDYRTLFTSGDRLLIWMSNLCFGQKITNGIVDKLLKELSHLSLVVLACSSIIENDNLKQVEPVSIKMSWSETSTVYIYQFKKN